MVPGIATNVIDVSTPLSLEFEFWNFQHNAELNYSLVLYTDEEIAVLNTISDWQLYSAGIIKGVCHIPGDFLNSESYRVCILVVQNAHDIIFRDADVLTFQVADVARRGSWHGKWLGTVRPKFEWTTKHIPFSSSPNGTIVEMAESNGC